MIDHQIQKKAKVYSLVLDIGTHAVRSAIIEHRSTQSPNIQFLSKKTYELSRLSSSYVEQDADDILRQTRFVLDDALTYASEQEIEILSAGIAIQRSTVVAWSDSGQSLHPALSWQDTRGQSTVEAIKKNLKKVSDIKRISGLPLSAHYGATKISWLYENVKTSNIDYCGPLISFLLFNLLKSRPYFCDESNVGRTQLYDILKRQWSQPLCNIFGVDLSRLPEVVPVEFEYGDLDISFSNVASSRGVNIPLKIVCGDQNSAYQYMSWVGRQLENETEVIKASNRIDNKVEEQVYNSKFEAKELARTIAINSGSGAFVLTEDTRKHKTDTAETEKRFLQSLVFSNAKQTQYVLEGTVNGVGTALSWICEQWISLAGSSDNACDDNACDIDSEVDQGLESENPRTEKMFFKNLDRWCSVASSKYLFLNTIGGIGSPYWISGGGAKFYEAETLKSYFTNNSPRHINLVNSGISRSDLDKDTIGYASVAVMESIIFLIAANVEGMLATQTNDNSRDSKSEIKTIVIGGGVSRSDYLCQGLSDLLNMRVRRITDHDATALGVATMLSKTISWKTIVEQEQQSSASTATFVNSEVKLDEFYPKSGERGQPEHLPEHYRCFKQIIDTLQ